ncbi:amino acid kinase family [Ceratobasidium sp. AG-Ba]|nr:amino acid kinase family [Ceratobasidium sp. AG-Ba]
MALLQNPDSPNARWVIQKFGGTSVGKFAAKIAEEVVPAYLAEDKVALVCSARSGSTKALGTTNLLLKAATEALRQPATGGLTPSRSPSVSGSSGLPWSPTPRRISHPQTPSYSRAGSPGTGLDKLAARTESGSPPRESTSPQTPVSSVPAPTSFSRTVDLIRMEHVAAARDLIRDPDLLRELENEILRDCEGLRAFLGAAQLIEEISARSRDSILGVGERLACKLVATVLRDRGVDAEFVSLESIVPVFEGDTDGKVQLDQAFYDSVAKAVGERLEQCGRRVPVVTGFFGPVPGSLLAQIGRGYTDLLAALAAVGTHARELQIWKEVDGIFTADPRKVPTARLLDRISPDEAAELTYYGSEVIHPFTMAQAIRVRIPIRIKNVERPSGDGTVVDPDPDALDGIVPDTPRSRGPINLPGAGPARPHTTNGNGYIPNAATQRLPTAVTIKEHILVLNVRSNRKTRSHGFLARVFGALDRHGVVVDLISTSEVHVSMAIAAEPISGGNAASALTLGDGNSEAETIVVPAGTPRPIVRVLRELHETNTCTLSIHPGMAILSLVGRQMRRSVGVAGRMFDTLARGGVNIEMISQGASEINISCVIEGRDAVKALNLIHQGLLLVRGDGVGGKVGPWLY